MSDSPCVYNYAKQLQTKIDVAPSEGCSANLRNRSIILSKAISNIPLPLQLAACASDRNRSRSQKQNLNTNNPKVSNPTRRPAFSVPLP